MADQFGERILPVEMQDGYDELMRGRKFMPNAIVRDASQMEKGLQHSTTGAHQWTGHRGYAHSGLASNLWTRGEFDLIVCRDSIGDGQVLNAR